MTWTIRFALLSSMVFSTQIIFGVGQAAIPWQSTQLAENFIASFQRAIARSSAFSSTQLEYMSVIPKTVIEAMEKFNSSNTTSKTKFQALNMVFASEVTEVSAVDGNVNIELKANTIENALNSAFLETFGFINTQFVGDIKSLISILSHTTANVVSTESGIKAGGYKQASLKQQGPSSAEVMRINNSKSQRGPLTEQQRSPALDSFMVLNVQGGPQRSSLQTISENQARGTQVAYSQGLSRSKLQESSSQVPSAQDQLGPGGNRTGVATAAATGGGLGPAGQSTSRSGVKRLLQQGTGANEQIGQESAIQGKSGAASHTLRDDGPKASTTLESGSYGVESVILGQPGPSGIGGKGPGIQDPPKSGNEKPEGYGTRAASTIASQILGGDGPMTSNAVGSSGVGSVILEQHGPSRIGEKVPNIQEPSKAGNQRPDGYRTRTAASSAESQRLAAEGPTTSTTAASGIYGVGSVILGRQEPTAIGEKEPDIQEPSKAGNQRPDGYGTQASASAAVGENKPGRNTKGQLRQEFSGFKAKEQSARGSFVPINKKPEAFNPGFYGWDGASSVSEGVAGYKPLIGTRELQERKGPSGKDAKGSSGYDSRATTTVATGSYVTSTGTERFRQKGKDFQMTSRTRSPSEREIQAHLLSGQLPGNQGQYGYVYQKSGRFGVQAPGIYPPGSAATTSAGEYGSGSSASVSGVQVPPGQKSLESGVQGIDIRKSSVAESRSISPKVYVKSMASAVVAAEKGYESINGAKKLQEPLGQELNSSDSAVDGRNNNASGRAAAIAAAAARYDPAGPSKSSVSTPNGNSEISSAISSLVSGSPIKPFSLSNTVSSFVSQVSTANPDLSYCNILIQTLLEIISVLVHLLGSCNIGQFNFGTSTQHALMTGQSAAKESS